jgi:hypothetical protein
MISLDDGAALEFVAARIYAGYGAHTPWEQAHEEIRKMARKDARSAIAAFLVLEAMRALDAPLQVGEARPCVR